MKSLRWICEVIKFDRIRNDRIRDRGTESGRNRNGSPIYNRKYGKCGGISPNFNLKAMQKMLLEHLRTFWNTFGIYLTGPVDCFFEAARFRSKWEETSNILQDQRNYNIPSFLYTYIYVRQCDETYARRRMPGRECREFFFCKGFTQATPTNPFTSNVD